MDPLTHGVFGALWALPAARREQLRPAVLAGAAAGMAADLDALIRSREDSLLSSEYHRQFTHALAFVPIGSLAVALLLWPGFRQRAPFGQLYLWCLLAYLAHPLLDACTSYGTQLFWPIADQRVAWNWISVIDPVYSVPMAALLAVTWWRRQHRWAWMALLWMLLYMAFGAWQNQRVEALLAEWASDRAIPVERLVAKPAFANLLLWRGLIDDGQNFHLVAVRGLPWTESMVYPGGVVPRFRVDGWDPTRRLGQDLARFDHFSSRWLIHAPEHDQAGRHFIGDFRYAMGPASQRPLWGILIDPDDPDARAEYTSPRRMTAADRQRFFQRLRGLAPEQID